MKMMARLVAACLAITMAACGEAEHKPAAGAAPEPVIVAAASSLTDVMKEIGVLYAAAGHPGPKFSFAATSELVRQIEQGAQVDVFISADSEWMNYLAEKQLIDLGSRRNIASNMLVLIAPAGRAFDIRMGPGMNLRAALGDGRIAIANPDGVPAGKYARDALQTFGAWDALEGVIARTENVRAALRFVEVGEAAAGIVYQTDVIAAAGKVVIVGRFPPISHEPIVYPAAQVTGGDAAEADAFLDFLESDAAREAFARFGFGPSQ
jgi:molybdate transport system substrate-binding protein